MAGGLQRSPVTFRREGTSGLVWDDRFLTGELNPRSMMASEQNFVSGESASVRASKNHGERRKMKPKDIGIRPVKTVVKTRCRSSDKHSRWNCCPGRKPSRGSELEAVSRVP